MSWAAACPWNAAYDAYTAAVRHTTITPTGEMPAVEGHNSAARGSRHSREGWRAGRRQPIRSHVAIETRAAARLSLREGKSWNAFVQEPARVFALMFAAGAGTAAVLAVSAAPLGEAVAHHSLPIAAFGVVVLSLAWTPIEIYGRGSFTFAGAGLLATAFAFGVAAGMVAAFLVAGVVFVRNKGLAHRALFNAATLALSAGAGGAIYGLATSAGSAGPRRLGAAVVAGAVFYLVNIGLLSAVMAASEKSRIVGVWKERFRWLAPYYLASGALALAICLAYQKIGVGGLAAFALPPAFMMLSTRQYLERTRESVEDVRRTNEDLAELLRITDGLARRAHNSNLVVEFAETELAELAGGPVRISQEPSAGALPLLAGGAVAGWLHLSAPLIGNERWDRIKDALLPGLATALENTTLVARVLKGNRDLVAALSRSLEAKDHYTGGHTGRVAEIAGSLARRLGFEGEDLEAIEIGALVHDIGKVGVPEAVLNKPGPLSDDEWILMKRHPLISDSILEGIDLHPFVRQAARSSHERIDGRGYPDGLQGEAIPVPARIVLVADAWDALTSDRSYRQRRSVDEALAEIRAHVGTQFCPAVVAALEAEFTSGSSFLHEPVTTSTTPPHHSQQTSELSYLLSGQTA
jgi:HD-GYP domain-containing protein (c-di-GMP phosphodiesterase class II)